MLPQKRAIADTAHAASAPSIIAVNGDWRETTARRTGYATVVPAEGLEPPTFGLQNRCSTN
jgi:hypothetical protein